MPSRRCARSVRTPSIEVEVETLEQVDEALDAGADILLLDNMTIDEIRGSGAAQPRPREDRDLRRRHARAHSRARRDRRRLRLRSVR